MLDGQFADHNLYCGSVFGDVVKGNKEVFGVLRDSGRGIAEEERAAGPSRGQCGPSAAGLRPGTPPAGSPHGHQVGTYQQHVRRPHDTLVWFLSFRSLVAAR